MFTTLIVQPIFNLLVLIYALIPGHNFGLAVIIFTVLARLLLWPLVKKQLHQTKAMRKLQPEIKKIKKAAKGNRQQESLMLMELYKERGISPFSSLGPLLLQLPIVIGLYSGLNKVVKDPQQLVDFAYPSIQHMGWMEQLAKDIHRFDETLLGVVDLTRSALGTHGVYWPAMVIVVAAAVTQYFQAKQLSPSDKNSKSLREILKAASEGKEADQTEMNAAVSRSTRFLIPGMIFIFTVSIASALSLYILVSGLVAYVQQYIVLNKDEEEMEAIADGDKGKKKSLKNIPEAEIVESPTPKTKTKKQKSQQKRKKRRK
jgi:YidC/Oxa1 family membrane protein insertase